MSTPSACDKLSDFIDSYQAATEKEKLALGKVFNDKTGGTLSPFNSPKPVCVGLVPVMGMNGETGFLGITRAIPPFIGGTALVGGFLSPNENPVDGLVRELLEETGISIDPKTFTIAGLPVAARNNNLLIFMKSAKVLSFEEFNVANQNVQKADGEAFSLVFVTPQTKLCFPLHQDAVDAAFLDIAVSVDNQPISMGRNGVMRGTKN